MKRLLLPTAFLPLLLLAPLSSVRAQAPAAPTATPVSTISNAAPTPGPIPPTISNAAPTPGPVPSTITPPAALPPTVTHIRHLVRDVKQNSDNIKSKGNFGAQLWLIGNEGFFQDWRKPEAPTLDSVELIVRGQPIFTAIIFYGPSHDDKGLSYVSYDLVVRRPDGSVYSERKDMVGFQNLAPGDERMLELGRNYLSINIGTEDPVGLYTVEATVHDNAARVELPLKQQFVVQ